MQAASTAEPGRDEPIELVYIPENAVGVIAIRPAATFRARGDGEARPVIDGLLEISTVRTSQADGHRPPEAGARAAPVPSTSSGSPAASASAERNKRVQSCTDHVRRVHGPDDPPVRLAEDAPAWGIETTEVREGAVVYHRFKAPAFGPGTGGCTAPTTGLSFWTARSEIRSLIRRGGRSVPAFVQNADWERASRGLLAVVINNQRRAFAKDYDLGRPDDAVVLSLVKGVDHWVLGVAEDDALVFRAAAACQSPRRVESLVRTIGSLRTLGQKALEQLDPGPRGGRSLDPIIMAKALLANLRVDRADQAVSVRAEGFGTLADFAALARG